MAGLGEEWESIRGDESFMFGVAVDVATELSQAHSEGDKRRERIGKRYTERFTSNLNLDASLDDDDERINFKIGLQYRNARDEGFDSQTINGKLVVSNSDEILNPSELLSHILNTTRLQIYNPIYVEAIKRSTNVYAAVDTAYEAIKMRIVSLFNEMFKDTEGGFNYMVLGIICFSLNIDIHNLTLSYVELAEKYIDLFVLTKENIFLEVREEYKKKESLAETKEQLNPEEVVISFRKYCVNLSKRFRKSLEDTDQSPKNLLIALTLTLKSYFKKLSSEEQVIIKMSLGTDFVDLDADKCMELFALKMSEKISKPAEM